MLKPIENPDKIQDCITKINKRLMSGAFEERNVKVNFPGGDCVIKVAWIKHLHFWGAVRSQGFSNSDLVHWCVFGTSGYELKPGRFVSCKITIPKEGADFRHEGVFLRATDGAVYLAHTGRTNLSQVDSHGTKQRLSTADVLNHFRSIWHVEGAKIGKNNKVHDFIIIASIGGPSFVREVAQFVKEYKNFKEAVRTAGVAPQIPEVDFSMDMPEFRDDSQPCRRDRLIENCCIRREVIDALYHEVIQTETRPLRDMARDLSVYRARIAEAEILFHVTTDISTTSIYKALGQLFYHGRAQVMSPTMVLVLPGIPRKEILDRLELIGIKVLSYEYQNGIIAFQGIQSFLDQIQQMQEQGA